MAPVDVIYEYPVASALLSLTLLLLALWQLSLGPSADWTNRVRRRLWPRLDPLTRPLGRPLVNEKSREEYVATVDVDVDELEVAVATIYAPNLASTLKYIELPDGTRAYEVGSWVYRPRLFGKWQHHCYIFKAANGGSYHLHHHKEINYVYSPPGHTGREAIEGDPDDVLVDGLDDAGVDHYAVTDPVYAAASPNSV